MKSGTRPMMATGRYSARYQDQALDGRSSTSTIYEHEHDGPEPYECLAQASPATQDEATESRQNEPETPSVNIPTLIRLSFFDRR